MQDLSQGVVVRLFVPGRARTKGSLEPIHTPGRGGRPCRIAMRDNDLSKAWKEAMIRELRADLGITVAMRVVDGKRRAVRTDAEPYAGPVELRAWFLFEREIGVGGEVWPSHNTDWPTAPDIGDTDKLLRNVGDALTQAGVIADDALIVDCTSIKLWTLKGESPGVLIEARTPMTTGSVRTMIPMDAPKR